MREYFIYWPTISSNGFESRWRINLDRGQLHAPFMLFKVIILLFKLKKDPRSLKRTLLSDNSHVKYALTLTIQPQDQKGTKSLIVVSRSSSIFRYSWVVSILACPSSLLIWDIGTPARLPSSA